MERFNERLYLSDAPRSSGMGVGPSRPSLLKDWIPLRLLSLVVLPLCLSCSKTDDNRIPVYPVRGQVLVGGQPADNAQVVFHPLDPDQRLHPHGRVDADGEFQLSTYELNDGAPAGEYTVTITWSDPPPPGSAPDAPEGPDKLEGRFANPKTSPLRARVEANENELEPFHIE